MSKQDFSVPKVRDIQAWQPSRMPALVPVAGDSDILKP